jgi:tellurite resistance protein
MFDLSPETEIREDQAEAIARGLIAVAKADGHMHEREAALISDFYAATTDRAADLTALEKAEAATGEYLAATLPSDDLRRLFLKTAMLLAYVDGKYSNHESKLIGEYGVALGYGNDLPSMEQEVKEFMLSQLTGIRNSEAVAEVAKELKVGS